MPASLVHLVDQAQSALVSHPVHDLPLGYRRAIWTAMGPRGGTGRHTEWHGWLRRVHVARLAAEFVLPIWETHWPGDDTPHQLLSAATQVLKETLNRSVADRIWQRWFDAPFPEHESRVRQTAWEVLYCADQVLAAALWDERFDPGDENLAVTDLDINPTELDASFFAACSYAGGGTWEKESNPARRRQFWEWWLTNAVPSAFHSTDR